MNKDIFKGSTYSMDKKLFKELGLKEFENLDCGKKHFVGKVVLDESYVEIYVECLPAQFYTFEIYDAESGKQTTFTTGSGGLYSFWETAKLIATNMFVFKSIVYRKK